MKTTEKKQVALKGSEKAAPAAQKTGTLNTAQVAEVTIRVRRKESVDEAIAKGERMTNAEYEKRFGASDEDLKQVEDFAHEHHLSIVESSSARRSVIVRGSVADLQEAFGVQLEHFKDETGCTFRGRSGVIHIPAQLEGIIEGVFGLDDRPHARPMFQIRNDDKADPADGRIRAHSVGVSYTPPTLAKIYNFPTGVTGAGQGIGIIELGGGYRTTDLNNYFKSLKLTPPSIKAISVDGATNRPSNANSDDGEVMLDIEVAGAVAPGAAIAVYFATNTDKGFLDAITKAIHDTTNKISVLSISWGGPESSWTKQSLTSFNQAFQSAALLGVTITVASGDAGSADGVPGGKLHVDFPSSSPFVLACGGTSLNVSGTVISSEVVWHDSNSSAGGGGVSEFFALPTYQSGAGVPASPATKFAGRGVPDVAANADPNTGYQVLVDGQSFVIGGTSAVAPLMAGLVALINEQKKTKVGFINPVIYANPAQHCRDITVGNNDTTSHKLGFQAKAGWDACTGLGVLNKI
jgi:kumamolisin